MLYLFEDMDKVTQGVYEAMLPRLSDQRYEKVKSYRGETDKKLCAVSYLLLRYALIEEYNMTGRRSLVDFEYIKNEKPVLRGCEGIYFNMSHCICGAVCALSDQNIGVDIQDIRPFRDSVLDRIAAPDEKARVLASSNPQRDFCRLWSFKECISKLRGGGLAEDFSKITEKTAENLEIMVLENERYILTCSEKMPLIKITLTQLRCVIGF